MSGQSTPAGWYPDPQNPGQQRYWDGTTWSESTQPSGAGVPAPAPGQQVGYGFAQGGAAGTPADFGKRALAYIIDWLIVFVPGYIISIILAQISAVLGLLAYLGLFAAFLYYTAYFEGGETGQTIGKKQMGIKVVDGQTGQTGIGMNQAAVRALARIVSGFVCGLGFLWMLWDEKKETWHDKLVKPRVVLA
jgi:uncharacterized RDD family membrane protein YckC